MVRHAVPFGEAAQVLVVRDDRDDVDRQRARRPAVQHAVQAVAGFRHAHDDAAPLAQVAKGPGHVERRRHARAELALEFLDRRQALAVVVKHGPHEGPHRHLVVEMLRLGDQGVVAREEARDRGNDARGVGTIRGQNVTGDGFLRHVFSLFTCEPAALRRARRARVARGRRSAQRASPPAKPEAPRAAPRADDRPPRRPPTPA